MLGTEVRTREGEPRVVPVYGIDPTQAGVAGQGACSSIGVTSLNVGRGVRQLSSVMIAAMSAARDAVVRPSNVREFPRERASDAELVHRVASGDSQALMLVWERYAVTVRSALFASLGPDHAIDDLLQEVFLGFFRRAARIENPSALRSYLLGAAVRIATFERRTRARRSRWIGLFASDSQIDAVHAPEAEANDIVRSLTYVLEQLPERAREAFVLRYVDDLSPAEVAVALGVSESTAKRAISKGRERVLYYATRDSVLHGYLSRVMGGRL